MNQPNKSSKKKLWIILPAFLTLLVVIQFFGPTVSNPPVSNPMQAPEAVEEVLRRSCYDCHSNETRLSWFDKIAPASWLVSVDIKTARSRFNFSTWDTLSYADQQGKLWEMVNMVLKHKMPLETYVTMHPEAKLTEKDTDVLKKYINSLNPLQFNDSTVIMQGDKEYQDFKDNPKTDEKDLSAPNGVKYINDFRNWQVISTTNRFDNHSIRIIYGNDVAVKAIKSNNIRPFPDRAVLIKVVWNSIEGENGDIKPGSLNSVQIMTKDNAKFPESEGWGFAKFNGINLKPFGGSAAFNATCFNCHKIASDNGYVFNIPLPNDELK